MQQTRGTTPQEHWPEALDAIEELIRYHDAGLLDKHQLRDRLELVWRSRNQADLSLACILPASAPTNASPANDTMSET